MLSMPVRRSVLWLTNWKRAWRMVAMSDVLNIRGLTVAFGGVVAIDGVNLDVPEGQIHGLVGPNGSGKTTLINCVSGFVRPEKGEIRFCGRPLMTVRPYTRAKYGIARSF